MNKCGDMFQSYIFFTNKILPTKSFINKTIKNYFYFLCSWNQTASQILPIFLLHQLMLKIGFVGLAIENIREFVEWRWKCYLLGIVILNILLIELDIELMRLT